MYIYVLNCNARVKLFGHIQKWVEILINLKVVNSQCVTKKGKKTFTKKPSIKAVAITTCQTLVGGLVLAS